MAQRPPKVCAHPGCTKLTTSKTGRCREHVRVLQKQYDEKRESAAKRGYDARWQKLRKMVLREELWCRDPFTIHRRYGERLVPATEVDHIIPKAKGGTDERENLQGLCKSCHAKKTRMEGQ